MRNYQSIKQSVLCKICIKSNKELLNNDKSVYKTIILFYTFSNTFPGRKDFGFKYLVFRTATNTKRQQRTFQLILSSWQSVPHWHWEDNVSFAAFTSPWSQVLEVTYLASKGFASEIQLDLTQVKLCLWMDRQRKFSEQ